MSVFEWKEDYSVGVDAFDAHHQKLFGLLNDLSDLLSDTDIGESLHSILANLLDYTYFHFEAEEAQMLAVNYPFYEAHKAKHDAFGRHIRAIMDDAGNASVYHSLDDTFMLLHNWLVEHIMKEDKKYEGYF